MSSLSSIEQNILIGMNQEMLDMERNKRRLREGQRLANDNCRQHKRYYDYLLKKQELFVKHKDAQREELYNAVMAGDATRIKKVEAKMSASNNQAQEVQLQIPTRLKNYAAAIKLEQEYDEAIDHIRHKMSLKSEEIHKFQPCETFLCNHCRGGTWQRPRKQEKRRYREEIGGTVEEDKQSGGMMSRIVHKVKSFSL